MKLCYCIITLILSFTACYGQTDSLLLQGREYAKNRDFTQAEICFKKALDLTTENLLKAKINNNLGLLNHFQRDFNEAITYYNKAITIYKAESREDLVSATYLNLGVTLEKTHKFSSALEYYNRAYKLSKNKRYKSLILNNIFKIGSKEGNLKIIDHLKQLLKDEPNYYLIKQNIARLYSKTNQIDSAVYYYRQAIKDQGYNYTPISLELHKEIGDLFYRNEDFENAWGDYHKAIEVFRHLQTIYIDDDTKLKSIEKYKDVFISSIESSAKLGELEPVIAYMEELKAPILESKLAMNRLADSLKSEYRAIEHKISRSIESEEFGKFDSLIKRKYEILKGVEVKQRKNFRAILKAIPEDMAMIHYAYSDSLLTACSIFNKTTKISQIPIDADFFVSMDTVIRKTKMFGTPSYQDYLDYLKDLNALYSVFEPTLPKEAKRIVILPYSKLYQIPFEALTNSGPDNEWADYTNINYLINRYAISYSPSIATLQYHEGEKVENAVAFIPDYSVDSLQLPYSLSEAKYLKKYFPTDIIKGKNASAENFFNTIEDYDIISVIAHGKSEEIILDNDTIKAEELYKLTLDNPLTVLSTCKSNTGELQATEGYIGTARKFLEAGSRSVLATLWDIPDESTKDIMSDFYKNLSNGDPKDIALQKAKVNYLSHQYSIHRSPSFWSGLILIGNGAKLNKAGYNYSYVVLGIILFILLVALMVKNFRRLL